MTAFRNTIGKIAPPFLSGFCHAMCKLEELGNQNRMVAIFQEEYPLPKLPCSCLF